MTGNSVQFGAAERHRLPVLAGACRRATISGNSVYVTIAGGATGMLFDSVTGPGSLSINGNTSPCPTARKRHHLFQRDGPGRLGSMTYTVNLSGRRTNNIIQGAATPFSVPAATTTGGILVNGAVMP